MEKTDFIIGNLKNIDDHNISILDIACNDGELTKLYTEYGSVLGIDVNDKAIKKCRENGLNCKLLDIMKIPESFNNVFDVVIAGDIIEHIFDTDKFLDSVNRVLKKGGKLLLTTPNLASFGRRIMLVLGINPFIEYSVKLPWVEYNVGHVRYYTYKDLYNQLQFHNFKNIRIVGDKINLTANIRIPYSFSRHLPKLCQNLMVYCEKDG